MKIKNKIIALMLCAAMLLLSLCSCGLEELIPDFMLPDKSDSYHEIQQMVSVMIEDGDHYTVTSQNPVKVNKGGTAVFTIDIEDGYEFDSSDAGEYKDGVLIVSGVVFPTTVSIKVKKESIIIGGDDDGTDDGDDDGADNGDDDGTDNGSDDGTDDGTDDGADDQKDHIRADTPLIQIEITDGSTDNVGGGSDSGSENEDKEDEKEDEENKDTETVILTAPEAEDGYHFICWTLDAAAEEGGELLSDKECVEYELSIGRTPIANFVDNEHFVILYRTNGGTTKDGKDYYYQTFRSANYYMPNTVYQNGTFVRDGYVLMRYTANSDGSGDYTTLGGKIEVNDNGFVELWLKWGKATTSNFEYGIYETADGENAAFVNSYTGKAINVVIPESITHDGITYPVKKIVAGAFNGVGIATVVIPSTIHTIEDGAFVSCENLHTITVHDNLWQVSDKAFSGCDRLSTYYLNAAHHPVFAGSSEGLFCLKYEKLRMAARYGKKKIMVMSGSSSLYGFSATQMEEAFGGEYTVINYGTNAGANGMLYLDAFARFFGEGDIIIHAPEMNNSNYLGAGTTTYLTFRGTEAMYEIFSYVDMRKHPGFFDGLCDFNQTKRIGKKEVPYDRYGNNDGRPQLVDKTSDMPSNKDVSNYQTQSPKSSYPYNKNSINAKNIENVNAFNERMKAQGTTMYYSFAPINKESLKDQALVKENQDEYVARLREVLDYEVISHPSDYILEQIYFNNSDYHPGVTGRQMRTAALIADLKAQLIKEGKWEELPANE